MDTLAQDVRYATRTLLGAPAFTIVVVLTLGVGIGANAAIFSVVSALVLRPMPVKDPAQITVITSIQHQDRDQPGLVSYLDYLDYRAGTDAFQDMSAARVALVGLNADGSGAERIMVSYVTSNYFAMFGIEPAAGRVIHPGEGDAIGTGPVVVLGHSYWKRRFGARPDIVGKGVRVNGHPCTIIGVVPEHFLGASPFIEMEAYLPIGMSGIDAGRREAFTRRGEHRLRVYGRLGPGTDVRQAQASLELIAKGLEREYPDTNANVGVRVFPELMTRPEPGYSQQNPLIAGIFLALSNVVLVVACVNVTSLFLARAAVRRRELAVRAALGASRCRLARQLLTESALLALAGGLAGVVIGLSASRFLASIRLPTEAIPVRFDFALDWRGLAYATVMVLMSSVLVGTLPALQAARSDPAGVVRDGVRPRLMAGGRYHLRDALVAGQIAASLVLLVIAGLFVRSLGYARQIDLGFRPDGVLNVSMDTAQLGYDEARGRAFFRDLKDRVQALPGVQSASWAAFVPLGYAATCDQVDVEGRLPARDERRPTASCNFVDADYFDTMGVTLVHGRAITEHDTDRSPRVAVINQTMARQLWPGEEPIGKRFSFAGSRGPWLEVVGVARNGRYDFLFEQPTMYFYAPLTQNYRSARTLHVRNNEVPPATVALAVLRQIRTLDPELPAYDVQTMADALQGGNGFFLPRIGAAFAAVLGGLGLLLAVIGVYGVVSYGASQRTAEIGLRMALGARPRDVLAMILQRGVADVLAGVGAGIILALVAGRTITALLAGVSAADPGTFGVVSIVFAAVVLTACWLPARRAARVDPLTAIREG